MHNSIQHPPSAVANVKRHGTGTISLNLEVRWMRGDRIRKGMSLCAWGVAIWLLCGCGGSRGLVTGTGAKLSAAREGVVGEEQLASAQKLARKPKCPTEGQWQGTFSGDCSGTWTVTVQNGNITGTASGSCDGEDVNEDVEGQVTGKKFNFAFGTVDGGECTFKGKVRCSGGVSTVSGTWNCGRKKERGTFEGHRL